VLWENGSDEEWPDDMCHYNHAAAADGKKFHLKAGTYELGLTKDTEGSEGLDYIVLTRVLRRR